MKIKFFPFFIVIFFLSIFFIFYKGLKNSNIYTPEVSVEKKIPSFSAKLLDTNNEISSDKIFKSEKFYLMNIWASWCLPCRKEHNFLMYLSKKKNLKIIGLNYKDNALNAQNFLNELGNPFNISLTDKDGTIAIEWGAYGVPETFLIYDKKIIKKIIGPLNKDLITEIKEIIE